MKHSLSCLIYYKGSVTWLKSRGSDNRHGFVDKNLFVFYPLTYRFNANKEISLTDECSANQIGYAKFYKKRKHE